MIVAPTTAIPLGPARSGRRHERRDQLAGARGECEQPGTLFKLPARQHFKQLGGMSVIAAQGFSHIARVLDVNDVHHDSFGHRAKFRDFDSCVTTPPRATPGAEKTTPRGAGGPPGRLTLRSSHLRAARSVGAAMVDLGSRGARNVKPGVSARGGR